jgi:two-component system CheB/CheR fusion protein
VLAVRVTPLHGAASQPLGASITFEDVTTPAHLSEEFESVRRRLESAYEDRQSTVEELETTNEALQSTNEELETTNEELHATNEELETTNEELQSTNDELETMNDEQRLHAAELDRANLALEGILEALDNGVIVLDEERRVQWWNEASAEMWGLRADEVQGVALSSLGIGLPSDARAGAIGRAAEAEEEDELVVRGLSRRGRSITCAVRLLPLPGAAKNHGGAIVLVRELRSDGGTVAAEPRPRSAAETT